MAVTPMELLRPESDLARLVEHFAEADLLVAADDRPAGGASPATAAGHDPAGHDPAGHDPAGHDPDGRDPDGRDPAGRDALDDDPADDEPDDDGTADDVARLGLSGLRLHRLGLRAPLTAPDEDDVVAALSELVGFDPEPGVYCLAPVPAGSDLGGAVLDRAVQRIARVYGLPLLRYRCLELSVVGEAAS